METRGFFLPNRLTEVRLVGPRLKDEFARGPWNGAIGCCRWSRLGRTHCSGATHGGPRARRARAGLPDKKKHRAFCSANAPTIVLFPLTVDRSRGRHSHRSGLTTPCQPRILEGQGQPAKRCTDTAQRKSSIMPARAARAFARTGRRGAWHHTGPSGRRGTFVGPSRWTVNEGVPCVRYHLYPPKDPCRSG
jgi:hypothetical protein